MILFRGIQKLYTFDGIRKKDGRRITSADLGLIPKGAMLVEDGHIVWVGPDKQAAKAHRDFQSKSKSKLNSNSKSKLEEVDLNAKTVLPGFVESHTHLIFGGDRRDEFEMRNQGSTYQEIAARGGGILSTVNATRSLSVAKLAELGQARADRFVGQGVTTLEVKSGYGLNTDAEIRILKAAKKIKGPRVVGTFLGPHSIPKEKSRAEYMRELCDLALPQVAKAKLAERVDMFIEKNYFDLADAEIYFSKARELGFRATGHVEQLSRQGGARFLALRDGVDSVDHCVEVSDEDITLLAKSKVTAVLLPTADFYLKMKYPPARKLIEAGARVAVATDFNPGTSPTQDLSFVGVLSRLEMRMTLPEVLSAYTFGAARALGLGDQVGCLAPGYSADFLSSSGDLEDFFYQVGVHPVSAVFSGGKSIFSQNLKKS